MLQIFKGRDTIEISRSPIQHLIGRFLYTT
jgi:hypothetical protein